MGERKPLKKPRYSDGQVFGKLTIINYIGFQAIPNRNEDVYAHFYTVNCQCGDTRPYTQETLVKRQRLDKEFCPKCGRKRQGYGNRQKQFAISKDKQHREDVRRVTQARWK